MLKTYNGRCHCGAVRFEAELDLSQGSYRCNCSFCRRSRFWPAIAKEDRFRLIAGAEMLTEYVFNAGRYRHFFCKSCGIPPFELDTGAAQGNVYGVNIGCLEGVTEEELSKIPIKYVDGMNDDWGHAPKYTSHL